MQEKTMRVAYLGPEGSYSSLAAAKLCPQGECVPYRSFPLAVESLLRSETDAAVLPVENTLQGAVTQNLDLLYANESLYAVEEYLLPIEHRLIAPCGTQLGDIRRLFSHQQAILQCSRFIAEHLPQAEVIYTDSTMQSLSLLKGKGDAGIVGSHVQREGLCFLGGNIADERKNFTHFLLVKKGRDSLPAHSTRVYFAASCPHEPGSLLKMLQILSVYDLNMTKIESRPIPGKSWEYRFFVDFTGKLGESAVENALRGIEAEANVLRVLGNY